MMANAKARQRRILVAEVTPPNGTATTPGSSVARPSLAPKSRKKGSSKRQSYSTKELIFYVSGMVLSILFLMQVLVPFLSDWDNWHSDYSAVQRDLSFFESAQHLPVLVVGGSDGSGTRAVVDTLHQLGVPILFDDPTTFDIHASDLFGKQGWPKLITTVMEDTKGKLLQDWTDLSASTQEILDREIHKLLQILAHNYAESRRRERLELALQQRGRMPRGPPIKERPPPQALATNVAFAIKAPVAMLVLPILEKYMGSIRFLHVVRDGRDIALSSNQSPVLKFYNATYPHDYEQRSQRFSIDNDLYHVRAMQLWNDWNTQVYEWSQQRQNSLFLEGKNKTGADPPNLTTTTKATFDFRVVRTEDLLDTNSTSKLHALQSLAELVGSPMASSIEALCCLAQAPTKDHGKSTVHSELPPPPNGRPIKKKPLFQHRDGARMRRAQYAATFGHGDDEENMVDDTAHRMAEHRLRQKEIQLRNREARLELRESRLREKEEELQKKLVEQPEQKSRRRLSGEQNRQVPRQFLKQVSTWEEHVYANADTLQLETLEKLITFGNDALQQYDENAEALKEIMNRNEIKTAIEYLRKVIAKKTENATPPSKTSKHVQKVHARYGKWKSQMVNRTLLSDWLHKEGKTGLEIFGYEPARDWEYPLASENIIQCPPVLNCGSQVNGQTRRLRNPSWTWASNERAVG